MKNKWIESNDLKQLAIKWIKEFQKERTDALTEMLNYKDEDGIYNISKFFNKVDNFWMRKLDITEEDLKEKIE